jgi:hypothetical protein
MTHTVSVYKDGILLGTGTNTAASATTASYTGTAPVNGRNVQVAITSGTQAGAVYRVRLLSGSGTSSLVFNHVDSYPD